MMLPHERLRLARKEAGFTTASAAARRLGVGVPTYIHHENGRNDFAHVAPDYARVFKVDLGWLMTGAGRMRLDPEEARIPVEGYIGAGANVDWTDDDAISEAGLSATLPTPSKTRAVMVRGDSQYPRFLDGEILLVAREASKPNELLGHYACVQTDDGRRLIKILRRSGLGEDHYRLESHNAAPEESVRIIGCWRLLGLLPSADNHARPRPMGRRK